ncbi:unnamed protein product [Durusdinium trenchii]|uniref:Gustatory receptor n=1 Tax=Durusdinium trenchii TaxID=1381693 RepID=A0ABP0INW6_9DINO
MTPSLRTGKKGVCRACAKGHSYRSNCSHRKLPPPPFEDVSGKSLLETSGALSFILRFHIDTRLGIGSARCEWVSSLGLQRLRRCVNSLRAWKVWQQMSECSTEQLHGELPCQHGAMEDQRVTQGVQELSATEVLLTLWRMAIDHVVRFNRVRLVGFWALLPSCVPMIWRAVASSAEDTSRPDLILQAAFGRSPPVPGDARSVVVRLLVRLKTRQIGDAKKTMQSNVSKVVIYAVVTSALICYMHVFLAGLFAVMGIVHYKRMMMVLQSICRLTRPLFCVFPNLPQAQLSGRVGVENMRAVLACFEVTLRLGGRYQNRVEAYIATLASAATLGMSFIVVGVVIGVHNQMNSFTVVILSLNLGVTAIMFQMIWYGSKANENFGLLANNICRARWRNSVQKEDEDCEQVMSLAMERLAILCETEPVNIAGTVPTCDLGYSLLSVAGTIVAFVIGKLYNWDIPA